jgi:hypothetical protein
MTKPKKPTFSSKRYPIVDKNFYNGWLINVTIY